MLLLFTACYCLLLVSVFGIELQCSNRRRYQMNPVPDLHDTHARNRRQKVELIYGVGYCSVCHGYKLRVKKSRALNETPSQSYGMSLSIWDHTVLPATRQKRTHLALSPASGGTGFIYPRGMEGWVELGDRYIPRLFICTGIRPGVISEWAVS